MTPLPRRLLRAAAGAALAGSLGFGLLTPLPAARSEPVGVPVPAFRGGALAGWGAETVSTPPASLEGKTVTAVAAGADHSLVLTSDGTVTAWGENGFGQVTLPDSLNGQTVGAIAALYYHSLAIVSDGTIVAWGRNHAGQATVPDSLTGKIVTAVAAGRGHSLALTSEGTAIAWGDSTAPASLSDKNVTAVAAGRDHSLALTSDGRVTAWGRNDEGQATVPDSLTGKTVIAIAAGGYHSLALTGDGAVTAWGDNDSGQATVPASLAGETVTAIAAGTDHSLALTSDGTVIGWGSGDDGQVPTPSAVDGRIVTAIAGGGSHTLAIATGFAAERAPILTGSPVVGRLLTADAGRYTAKPDQLTYTWHADGTPVGSGSTFTPTAAQAGRRITVQVTAAKTGHAPVVTTSAASQPVIGPPTIDLTTTRAALRRGQTATLTWASTFASTVTASGAWTGARTPAGTLTIKPTRVGTTSYVLTATNSAGTATARARVRVIRPAARLRVQATVGKNVRVTVRGLEAGEHYTIRLGKRKVAGGTAKNAKPLVRAVKLPKKAGRVTPRVTGDQPDRTGSVRIRVRR